MTQYNFVGHYALMTDPSINRLEDPLPKVDVGALYDNSLLKSIEAELDKRQ